MVKRKVMKRTEPAQNPDEYVRSLTGWRHECVSALRTAVLEADAGLEEAIKWGHLVYSANGPVLLIRAEEDRVLFGFWRGKRLRDTMPSLRPSGMYEMATIQLYEGDSIDLQKVQQLAREAAELNMRLGDPRQAAKR